MNVNVSNVKMKIRSSKIISDTSFPSSTSRQALKCPMKKGPWYWPLRLLENEV